MSGSTFFHIQLLLWWETGHYGPALWVYSIVCYAAVAENTKSAQITVYAVCQGSNIQTTAVKTMRYSGFILFKLRFYTTQLQQQTHFVENIIATGLQFPPKNNSDQIFCQNVQSCSPTSMCTDYRIIKLVYG